MKSSISRSGSCCRFQLRCPDRRRSSTRHELCFFENSIDSIGGIGGERFAVRFQTIRTFVHTHARTDLLHNI